MPHHQFQMNVVNYLLTVSFYLFFSSSYASPILEIISKNEVQNGKFAFIDISKKKIVEYDTAGNLTWEYSIPWTISTLNIGSGADVEWLPDTDSFLFVVPRSGVYEVSRDKKIVWKYETKHISHDADRLPNGNVLFVNGWDAETDPTFTEVNQSGVVVQQWFAFQHIDPLIDVINSQQSHEAYSYTHANSIFRMDDGSTVVSLRNFNMYVVVKNGHIIERNGGFKNLHDPFISENKLCFAARSPNRVECRVGGRRTFRFAVSDKLWHPMRTVEPLKNGNLLITGSARIGQLSPTGQLVWSVKFPNFGIQKENNPFIYKATWVYK